MPISPSPRAYDPIYGGIPGVLDVPDSRYDQVSNLYPNLSAGGNQYLKNTSDRQQGKLPAGTISELQDAAAAWGVGAGQPFTSGGGLPMSRFLRSIGTNSNALTQQGDTDWLSFLTGVGSTQDDPNLVHEVGTQNSIWNAAPEPGAAGSHAEQLFREYMNLMSGPAGGGSRGPINMGSSGGGFGGFGGFTSTNDWLNSIGYGSAHTNPYSVSSSGGNNGGGFAWTGNNGGNSGGGSNFYMDNLYGGNSNYDPNFNGVNDTRENLGFPYAGWD